MGTLDNCINCINCSAGPAYQNSYAKKYKLVRHSGHIPKKKKWCVLSGTKPRLRARGRKYKQKKKKTIWNFKWAIPKYGPCKSDHQYNIQKETPNIWYPKLLLENKGGPRRIEEL